MFGENLLIKKCPYLGFSKNLIEYFGIIGYSEDSIPELVMPLKQYQSNTRTSTNFQYPQKYIISYAPTVLSSITSKTDYGIVDNDLIIAQLYPENPKIFLCEQNQLEPEKSNVIYSFCFDSTDGQEKSFYTCFGYKFYELYKIKNEEGKYYIPKAFCIISQFPFFNAFYMICNNLYETLLNKKNIVPFEILIYNIVNYVPSPINHKLELHLFSTEKEDPKIELNQLTGYPNLDFDLYEIFNLLPLNLILQIYILTFLEQNLLFFSSNLELLNTIMYIMYMFNYPCNDSTYFWHIVSVGKKNLVEENKFVGKIMLCLLGVNCTYEESIDTSAFADYHYVVDIDNKKLLFKESLNISIDGKEDSLKLTNLVDYIENIFKDRNSSSNILKKPLIKLKNNLENYLSEKMQGFSPYPKKNFVNFFKKEKIHKNSINIKILEFFYDCNLALLTNFYQDNELNTSFDKLVKLGNNSLDNSLTVSKYCDEEKYFLELFRNSVKYKIYFDNFMLEFEAMEVFKIPFLFSQIFLELKTKDPIQISCENLDYFNIIDQLYKINNNSSYMKKITFSNFNQHYIENMNQYFKKFFISDYDDRIFGKNEIEEKGKSQIVKEPRYQLIHLNKKIVNRYIYLLQNFYEAQDIDALFPQTSKKENKQIKIIDRRIIYQLVKNKLIEKKFIPSLNFLIYSVTYVIALTITLHPYEQIIKYLVEIQNSLKLIKYSMEHYIYTLIKSIYKYYLINKTTKKYPSMKLSYIKLYFSILANFIRSQFIVPNEETMYILKNFFSNIIFKERKEINLEEENKATNASEGIKEFVDVYKNQSYMIFMKYCFNEKKMLKSKVMVEKALLELESSNVVIKVGDKVNNPIIVIKINDYVYQSKFYSSQKIFRDSENIFEDFFDNYNFDFAYLDINKLREIILNLIQYGLELDDNPLPVGYLINTLYLLRNFEEENSTTNQEKENK